MIAALAKQRLWTESLTDEQRQAVVDSLTKSLEQAESPREIASVAKALASLEKNDIDKTRAVIDAEKAEREGDGESEEKLEQQRRFRAAVEAARDASAGSEDANLDEPTGEASP